MGIHYLINAYTSDSQHKKPQQQSEQPECQSATTPPPTLDQVLAMQAQMLQTMQQIMVNMQAARPQAPPSPLRDRIGDFQHTKPPTFSHAVEPMDANDWLKSVETKLQVVQCNKSEKVLLTSHQLSGPAVDW
jgi:hypothetical protein